MSKRPILLRIVFSLIIIAVFASVIFPLQEKDLYVTLRKMTISERLEDVDKLILKAKKIQEDNIKAGKDMYATKALTIVAMQDKIKLSECIQSKYLKGQKNPFNREIISIVRQEASSSIRLGQDLNGGVEFIFSLSVNKTEESAEKIKRIQGNFAHHRDMTIEILRKRLESKNIFEAEIVPIEDNLVSIKAPIVSKAEKDLLLTIIKQSAKLRFHLVHNGSGSVDNPPADCIVKTQTNVNEDGEETTSKLLLESRWKMKGDDVDAAWVTTGQFGGRQIILQFAGKGISDFAKVTTENKDRQLAVVLDGRLYSAPSIKHPITGGRAQITGDFTQEEAQGLATALSSGSLPLVIDDNITIFDTDPTLGKEHVEKGLLAGIIALLVVVAFMVTYYLRAGIIANIALAVNIVLILGFLAAFKATLTLPGIAGIILTMGMAVDANVLIFERIREELEKGKVLKNAISAGYARAFTTILDANLTTLFTAVILYWQGTGAIKGFAVTLSIGIATSMFTSLFLTRLIFDILGRYKMFDTMKMWKLFSQPNINFLKLRPVTIVISSTLILLTLVVFGIRGGDAFGIDFKGGTQVTFAYNETEQVPIEDIKSALKDGGYKNTKVMYKSNPSGTDNKLEIIIDDANVATLDTNNKSITPKEKISIILNENFKNSEFKGQLERTLGGLVGEKFRNTAIISIILAVLGIIAYISMRFEFAFAIASIIAIVHDVIIATGIYLLTGLIFGGSQLSLPVIAALLTIIGYSLNDTIVVFDRIREDISLITDKSYKSIINLSINQTLSRTALTSLTTLLVLIILLVLGGIAFRDFVVVMITGVLIGTYSSIFVASPIIAVWHKHIGINIKVKDEEEDEEAINI